MCIDHPPPADQCRAHRGRNKNCNYSQSYKFFGDNGFISFIVASKENTHVHAEVQHTLQKVMSGIFSSLVLQMPSQSY